MVFQLEDGNAMPHMEYVRTLLQVKNISTTIVIIIHAKMCILVLSTFPR